jgi:hypothetical protein
MAQSSRAENDKALWLTLAQSWVRLAEDIERVESAQAPVAENAEAS